jgi:RNA recognition motif-containing protein
LFKNTIENLFTKYGSLVDVQIINKNGINLAAYVTYKTKESCLIAIRNLNKEQIWD